MMTSFTFSIMTLVSKNSMLDLSPSFLLIPLSGKEKVLLNFVYATTYL